MSDIIAGFLIAMAICCMIGTAFLGVTYYERNLMEHGYVYIPACAGHWELRNPEKPK